MTGTTVDPAETPGTLSDTQLARAAITVLGQNWHGHLTVPAGSLYPHQWSWDSAFIALGLQHWAPKRAATELLSIFGAQWADGRVPHIAFNPAVAEEAYFPGPTFWRSDDLDGHPPVRTSGLIQPPVHAVAAAAVMSRLGEAAGTAFGERIYPCLVAQNAYLKRSRRVAGSGLAFMVHPWETGMDNSPAWDAPLAAVPADLRVFETYTRRDLDHASTHERPTNEDYARYIRLAAAYRDHGYDDRWAAAEAEFVVADPNVNALWAWSEVALAEIARRIGKDDAGHRAEADRITTALIEELYAEHSESEGLFHALDQRSGRRLEECTVGGLIPLVLSELPTPIVERLLATLTGEKFRAGAPEVLGVPSFDLTAPNLDPERYWRGPSWLNTNWMIATGLRTHGYHELADGLFAEVVDLAKRSGLREYFNPHTGSGHGADHFSWSAALVLDVLASR